MTGNTNGSWKAEVLVPFDSELSFMKSLTFLPTYNCKRQKYFYGIRVAQLMSATVQAYIINL